MVDHGKLRGERERCRKEIQRREAENLNLVYGLYFDGRKDDTLNIVEAPTGKCSMTTDLEEHIFLVG